MKIPTILPDFERIDRTFLTKHWDWKIIDPVDVYLVDALKTKLPHIDEASWPERLALGGLFVNGLQTQSDRKLVAPCRIEYYEPKFDYSKINLIFPQFDQDRICYEDEFLLVYVKPHGLPSVPSREQFHYNLRSQLEQYVGKPIHMPSRLDLSTYGLIPISKHPILHNRLQLLFQKRKIQKTYLLKTNSSPTWTSKEVNWLIDKHPLHPVLRCCSETDGKIAKTVFNIIKQIDQTTLIKAEPLTGRTHQIRVHAQALECPIIGDNFYNGKPCEQLNLACYNLKFSHPLTDEPLDIKIPAHLFPDWLNESDLE